MSIIPFGSLFFAWCTLLCVRPFRQPRRLAVISWAFSAVPNELPYLFAFIVIGSSAPDVIDGVSSTREWIAAAVALLTVVGLTEVARRALRTREAVEAAMRGGLGPEWRTEVDPALADQLRTRLPWLRILFVPWMFGRRDVIHTRNVSYADNVKDHRLDLYRRRDRPTAAPTLIYFHGGRFSYGNKNREAQPLLNHLASQGWTCISANYRLAADFPD